MEPWDTRAGLGRILGRFRVMCVDGRKGLSRAISSFRFLHLIISGV